MSDLITIGRITRHQGNKGEVRVKPLTDYPERFKLLDKVFLQKSDKKDEPVKKVIQKVWFQKNKLILKFKGIDNIGEAIELKNYFIKIDEKDVLPLEEDNYYIYEIIDLQVETKEGKKLGLVKDVLTTGGTDIFVVKNEKNEYLIPASKEIIINISISSQKIIVDPIPGLLDL